MKARYSRPHTFAMIQAYNSSFGWPLYDQHAHSLDPRGFIWQDNAVEWIVKVGYRALDSGHVGRITV